MTTKRSNSRSGTHKPTRPTRMTYETHLVILHLSQDTFAQRKLKNTSPETLYDYIVVNHNGPGLLYVQMASPPACSFSEVDWERVAEALTENE